jgi:purine-binding chemotaxis protein CheW
VYEGSQASVDATRGGGAAGPADDRFLLCEVADQLHALPLERVIETMRPLPVRPIEGVPAPVLGLAVVRGAAIPVIDAARLLGQASTSPPQRFVTLRVGERAAALAVHGVRGICALRESQLRALPPLLSQADGGGVRAMAMLDDALVLVLESARLVPPSVWATLESTAP